MWLRCFSTASRASADKEAFRYLVAGEWVSATWQQTADRVEALAAGLLALGIETEQRVGIASSTRYEWILADLAIMCAGAATTTVYPSTNAGDTAYILADSQCRIVFAEDTGQLAKLTERRAELPHLTKVVLFDGTGESDWVITLADLAELGEKYLLEHPSAVRTRTDAIAPEQLATLIYTSGTTGRPKGVRLPHSVWAYEGSAVAGLNILGEDDLQLLWLPMAHAFGKVLVTTQLACGFVTAIDGRVDKIVDNLAVIKPTFMGAAPRIFEKAHARIVTTQQAKGGLRARLFAAAFSTGLEVNRRRRAGRAVSLPMSLRYKLFDRLVFSKVREAFGGRIRFFISGAAPLNRDIGEWFHAAGLLILEGYGLTETDGRGVHQPARSLQAGHRGLALRRYVDTHPRRPRGNPDPRRRCDGRLSQPARQNGGRVHRRRLAAHRGRGHHRRRRVPHRHRPDQGDLQDLRWQIRRPAGDRGEVHGDVSVCQPVHGVRGSPQLLRGVDRPGCRLDVGVGSRERSQRRDLPGAGQRRPRCRT